MKTIGIYSKELDITGPLASGWINYAFCSALCGSLVRHNPSKDQPFELSLLESLIPNERNDIWEFRLRKDLSFHNGRSCTSDDLIFSVLRHLVSPTVTPNRAELLAIVGSEVASIEKGAEGISRIDSHAVRIKLKNPDPKFYSVFFDPRLSLVPQECLESDFFKWKDTPAGAGRFAFLEKDKNSATLVDRTNPCRAIKLVASNDLNTLSKMDLIIGCPPDKKPESFSEVVQGDSLYAIWGVFFNFRSNSMQSLDVRIEVRNSALKSLQSVTLSEHQRPNNSLLSSYILQRIMASSSESLSKPSLQSSVIARGPLKISLPEHLKWGSAVVAELARAGYDCQFVKTREECDIFFSGFVPAPYATHENYRFFVEGGPWVPRLDENDGHFTDLVNLCRVSETPENLYRLHKHFHARCYAIPMFEQDNMIYFQSDKVNEDAVLRIGFYLYFDQLF